MAIPRWDCNNTVEVVTGLQSDVSDDTETLSSAISLLSSDRGRCKILVVFRALTSPTGAYAHGVTFAVKESATAAGAYTAATTSGSLAIASVANTTRTVAVSLNNAMPFLKLSVTGDHADTLAFVTGEVIFISPSI